jgi:hypothetical protein
MNLNISYYKTALICNIPLFLVPVGIILSIIYGGQPGESYAPFDNRADSLSIGFIIWLPFAAFSLLLLFAAKKGDQLGRYASLISIVFGITAALIMYPSLVFGVFGE